MSQKSRPVSDVSTGLWTPVPVFPQVNEEVPNAGTVVTSSDDPQGDTFEVRLAPLAWPIPGPQQLTVSLGKSGPEPVEIKVWLLQGTAIIASTHTTIDGASGGVTITLSDTEKNSITDYTDLRVRVQARVRVLVPCCGDIPIPGFLTMTFANGTGDYACLNGRSVGLEYDPDYILGPGWINTAFRIEDCCPAQNPEEEPGDLGNVTFYCGGGPNDFHATINGCASFDEAASEVDCENLVFSGSATSPNEGGGSVEWEVTA
jgi:hypothetical protein